MGGQSFKCPECERWFFANGPLHDHLIGKHKYERGFKIKGIGQCTYIDREEYRKEVNEFLARLPKRR